MNLTSLPLALFLWTSGGTTPVTAHAAAPAPPPLASTRTAAIISPARPVRMTEKRLARLPVTPTPAPAPGGSRPTPGAVVPLVKQSLPPGLYKTAPYSCLVLVPGSHLDEAAVRRPPGDGSRMPIVKPDLQFIPWPRAK